LYGYGCNGTHEFELGLGKAAIIGDGLGHLQLEALG
jgi:hypothetical protein